MNSLVLMTSRALVENKRNADYKTPCSKDIIPKMSNSGSPPAKPGVYLIAIKKRAEVQNA
jgi:hypothetical protein